MTLQCVGTHLTFLSLHLCPPCSWPGVGPCSSPTPASSLFHSPVPPASCAAPCSVIEPLRALEQRALVSFLVRLRGLEHVFQRGRHQLVREIFAYSTEPPRAKMGLEGKVVVGLKGREGSSRLGIRGTDFSSERQMVKADKEGNGES